MFCSQIESEMDKASSSSKNTAQANGARHSVLMKYLYPDDPTKRFRSVSAAKVKGQEDQGGAGESFFSRNQGKRRHG